MEPSVARTEQFSGTLKSFVQHLRSMLAKPGSTSCERERSPSEWAAYLGDALQQSAAFTQEAQERQAAIAQIMQSADVSTKQSIADCLLFASDLDEAHDAIMTRDQQRRQAA
jgi:hypothetical protein